ncbi:winged helix-turn-helix domain-containing protein [Streptomyces sp. TR06-5]|uniref:winged helix-turn-helix domain-containing protein n=1 Tax=Streptomyces sp. TR06-5 TaxID=3385976 RepID=UPI0039A29DAB
MRKLLARNDWSCQVPARRAIERDDEAVAGWAREVRPRAKASGGSWGGWSSRTRRALHDAAARQDLEQTRTHPRGEGPQPLPQTHIHRCPDLLQARATLPADLPAPER